MTTLLIRDDEAILKDKLKKLDLTRRVAFLAACAERLFPAYRIFSEKTAQGKVDVLRHTLDLLWNDLGGKQIREEQLEELILVVEELYPDDASWIVEMSDYAVNAVLVVYYTLRHRRYDDIQDAVRAAQQTVDMIDTYITIQDEVDINIPHAEEHVLKDPLVQTELFYQARDLEELLCSGEPLSSLLAQIHVRATTEAFCFTEADHVAEIAWLRKEANHKFQAHQYLEAIVLLDEAVQKTRERRVFLVSSQEGESLKTQRNQIYTTFVRLDESPLMQVFKDHNIPTQKRQLLLYALRYYTWKALSKPGANAIVFEGKTYEGTLVDMLTHSRINWLTKDYILVIIDQGILKKEPDWVSYYFLERREEMLQSQGILPLIRHGSEINEHDNDGKY